MTDRYWVVGGEYAGTSFTELVSGTALRLSPFEGYAEAKGAWRTKAMATIDDAYARYRVERA